MGVERLDVGAEAQVHQLAQQDAEAEGGEQRDEEVALDDAEDHEPVGQPAHDEQHDHGGGDAEKGRQSGARDIEGDVAAEHDEFALADIDDVHDAPDQGEAVGGEREDGADQHAVDQQLHRQRRGLDQERQIVHRWDGSLPPRDEDGRLPISGLRRTTA